MTDVVKQLKLDADVRTAEYGEIVDMAVVDYNTDVVFTWNGTTSGVCMPNGDAISADRKGLTICDATSAALMDLPWDKLDVTTFSWQKVLGGEAAHGMLILSPVRSTVRDIYTCLAAAEIFRLTKGGKLIEGIFVGEQLIRHPCWRLRIVAALDWAANVGGLNGLIARATANAQAIWDFCETRDWIDNLAINPATRSNTSVCLKFTDDRIQDGAKFAKAVAKRLEAENVAYDIGAYRDAPAGLRVWCGGTVETSDIVTMLPWLEWAFEQEIAAQ